MCAEYRGDAAHPGNRGDDLGLQFRREIEAKHRGDGRNHGDGLNPVDFRPPRRLHGDLDKSIHFLILFSYPEIPDK